MAKNDKKYPVKCEECGNEYLVGYKTFKRPSGHICSKCIYKRNLDKMREGHRKYFSDPKNRENHSKLCKEVWNDRPEEFKSKRLNDLKSIGEKYRSSVDFSNISSVRMKEYMKDISHRMNLSQKKKEYWSELSKAEREMAMNHLVEYWNNITPEELDNYFKLHLDGMISANMIIKGPTEISFCDDLFNLSTTSIISYQWQYRSNIKHPEFDNKFTSNPITGGKYVNPYHIWDFIIYSKNGNILIDIDGSIHNTGPGKVSYNDSKIEFIDLIKFNESQRPYQTDGFDAYIVRAYDNKLNDDTEVLSLKDNTIINYKQLLSIIKFSQVTKDDIKEIKKLL